MNKSKFNIAKFPFFYGYIILIVGTIGVTMSSPGQTVGVSVFTDYLIDALEISRDNLSLAYLCGTLLSSFLITSAGRFFDKFGARVTSVLSAIMLGFSLYFLSEIEWVSNTIFGLIGSSREIIIFTFLVIGFFALRFSGQGVLTMAARNMVMLWFEKRRGMASAVMGIAISFGFSYSPIIFDHLIEEGNWQSAWQQIAIAVGIIFAIFAYFTFRDSPKKYGLIPDGKEVVVKNKNHPKYAPDKSYTLPEARKKYSFWIFTLTLSMHALYITALTFHVVDIFSNAGLTREDAISIFLPSSVIAVIFQLSSGYLADFIKLKYLLLVQLLGLLIAMIGLSMLSAGFPVYLIILGNGIGGGLFGVVHSVTWPRYFGTLHLGAISGFASSWVVAGSAIGPYMFSYIKDFSGSYQIGGIVCFIATFILFILSFKADNVNLKEE
ncbi:MAG: MFS transporter [Melioribacteraceae bacterium]|nr:MFS transporter [Melioribacteraceae bacterium]